MVRMVKSL